MVGSNLLHRLTDNSISDPSSEDLHLEGRQSMKIDLKSNSKMGSTSSSLFSKQPKEKLRILTSSVVCFPVYKDKAIMHHLFI